MPSKNAFTEFLNRYAGTASIADELTTAAKGNMAAAYLQAYNAISVILANAKRDVNYATHAKQTAIIKQVGEILDNMSYGMGGYLENAVLEIADYSSKVAIKDLHTITGKLAKSKDWHAEYSKKYAEQTFKDAYEHIAAKTQNMAASVKTMLRQEAAKVSRRAAIEGISRKDAYKLLRGEIQKKDPNFTFIDNAGRRWDTGAYFDMLTLTVMRNTLREVYADTLINEGKDLVRVTANGGKDACKKWEGRVLSLTGATPGYITLDAARATGEVFHPRCRHGFVVYNKDMDDIFKAVDEGKTDEEILGDSAKDTLAKAMQGKKKNDAYAKLEELSKDSKWINSPIPYAESSGWGQTVTKGDLYDESIVKTVNLSELNTSKKTKLFKEDIKAKIDEWQAPTIGGSMKECSFVVKHGGKLWVAGGHGNIAAKKIMGETDADVMYFDLDHKESILAKKQAALAKAKKEQEQQAAFDEALNKAKKKDQKEQATLPKPETKPEPATLPKFEKPEDTFKNLKKSDFEQIGPQKGSNPGGLFKHKATGEKFYIKIPEGADQAKKVSNEVAAAKLYEMAGIKAPELYVINIDGKKAVASKWQDGIVDVPRNISSFKKFHEGFAVDAWLANWDVAGLTFDNVAFDKDGKPVRIDVGGSLIYRAQGGLKGAAFGHEVTELKTFLDKGVNPQSAQLFDGMSEIDIAKSIKKVTSIKGVQIKSALKDAGFKGKEADDIYKTLMGRKKYLSAELKKYQGALKKSRDAGLPAVRPTVDKERAWAFEGVTEADEKAFMAYYKRDTSYFTKNIEKCKKKYPALTDIEARAYVIYTNSHFGDLNEMLYTNTPYDELPPPIKAYIKILNSAILKASAKKAKGVKEKGAAPGNAKGPWKDAKAEYYERKFRLDGPILHTYLEHRGTVGKITHTDSFLSSSQTRSPFHGNIHLYFKPKRGYAYVDPFSVHPGEDEVVIPYGINYKVVHVEEKDTYAGTQYAIYAEEV